MFNLQDEFLCDLLLCAWDDEIEELFITNDILVVIRHQVDQERGRKIQKKIVAQKKTGVAVQVRYQNYVKVHLFRYLLSSDSTRMISKHIWKLSNKKELFFKPLMSLIL